MVLLPHTPQGRDDVHTPPRTHLRDEHRHALSFRNGRQGSLYPKGADTERTARSAEEGASHGHALRAADHREDLQEQRDTHGKEQQVPVLAQGEHARTAVPDDRHKAQEHFRRQDKVLRNRRRQARPNGRSLPEESALPLRHRLRPYRDGSAYLRGVAESDARRQHRKAGTGNRDEARRHQSRDRRGRNPRQGAQCHARLLQGL